MGFFSSIGHALSSGFKTVVHDVGSIAKSPIGQILAPIAGGLALGPVGLGLVGAGTGAAIGGAANALAAGKGLKGAAITGGLDLAGNSIGNQLFPESIGQGIGSTASNAVGAADAGIGDALGQGFSQTASNALLNTSIGGAVGGALGGNLANKLTTKPQQPNVDPNSLTPAPFTPTRAPQLQLPGSLSSLQGQDTAQQTSNLATQGVYGGGLGPQEQSYFTNLVNNQLVDPSGKVAPTSSLSPIENSYLSKLGFGGYSNSNDLLGAISKWQAQQQGTSSTT